MLEMTQPQTLDMLVSIQINTAFQTTVRKHDFIYCYCGSEIGTETKEHWEMIFLYLLSLKH